MARPRRRVPVAKQERLHLQQCREDLQATDLTEDRRAELEARKHRAEVAVVKRSIKSFKAMIREDKRLGNERSEAKHRGFLESSEARLKELQG